MHRSPCTITFGMLFCLAIGLPGPVAGHEPPKAPANRPEVPKELQELSDLIGSWRGTGTLAQKTKEPGGGSWSEKMDWFWDFKSAQPTLQLRIASGRFFTAGVLSFDPKAQKYQLTLTTTPKTKLSFQGLWQNRQLTFERDVPETNETQRLVIKLLHQSRLLYRLETKPKESKTFIRVFEVGSTKEGVAFANDPNQATECVVTGGAGTIAVTYQGQTYYVCCTGCLEAFREDPDGIMKAYFERKKKKD